MEAGSSSTASDLCAEPPVARRRTESGAVMRPSTAAAAPSTTSAVSAAVAEPGGPRRGDGSGIRDELACIGEQIKALQLQLSSGLTPGSKIPDAAAQSMWSLLWRLRPFLYLAAPSAARQWRMGGPLFDVYHRGHYAKDAAHVAIALRLYLVVLRFTAVCPAAALHGCLTLLGVLAPLNDPRLRSWRDTSERLLDGFLFVARALRSTESDVFAQLLNTIFELLAEVTCHFNGATAAAAESDAAAACALYLRLAVEPTAASVAEAQPLHAAVDPAELDDLAAHAQVLPPDTFATCTCVETLYEARCVQASLLRLLLRLCEERLMPALSPDRVALLCDVACHLVASAVPGAEGGAVNRVQHESAWQALQHLAKEDGHLLAHVEGPLIVAVLVAQWGRGNVRACISVHDVTDAELSLFGWCAGLTEAELDALVAAAYHRGGTGLDGRGVVMEWLATMWELAVHWAVELFGSPEPAGWLRPDQLRAATTLQRWVGFCERLFAGAVAFVCRGTDPSREAEARSRDGEEHAHQLQLLASELPLASFTASLLCTQVPPALADMELLLLPRRILSFFQLPDLAACVADVVAKAKNCIDVSAYRLLEANALALQVRLPAPDRRLRCDATAFQQALTETVQVVQHHEKPSYALLVQALLVLVHGFPRDEAGANAPAKADVVARALQDLESAVSAHPHKLCASVDVGAPLWFLLYRESAQALFAAGTGLGWSRRLLASPPSLSAASAASARTTAVFLSQAAGLAAALEQTVTEVLRSTLCGSMVSAEPPRGVRLSVTASGPGADQHLTLRRTYDAFAAHLPVVVQVLQTASTVLAALQRDAVAWAPHVTSDAGGRSTSAAELDGVAGSAAAAVLCRSLAGILTCLLDAKYRFARLAGPEDAAAGPRSAAGRSPVDSASALDGAAAKMPTPSPAPVAAVVVDVDDDDDGEQGGNEEAKTKTSRRQRRGTRGTADAAAAQGQKADTPAPPSAAAPSSHAPVSRTQQLERVVQVNGSLLLPAAVAAAQHLVLDNKRTGCSSLPSARAGSRPADETEEGDSSSAACTEEGRRAFSGHLGPLRLALLRLAYASVALSPAYCSADSTRELFDLTKLRHAGAGCRATCNLRRCALRELLLWCPSFTTAPSATAASVAPNTRVVLLQRCGGEAHWHRVLCAKREGNATALADAGSSVLELLSLARRVFGRGAALAMPTSAVAGSLSDDALELQERCMAAADGLADEGRAWLGLCFDFYAVYRGLRTAAAHPHNDVALSVMGLCVEAARDVMALFAWSATDLLRLRARPFVFSSFFNAVVDKEDRDMKVVLSSSLDVLGRYVVTAGADESTAGAVAAGTGTSPVASTSAVVPGEQATRSKLRHLMEQEKIADWRTAAGAVAYVLYECGTKSAAKQAAYLGEVMSYVNKSIKDVPALVRTTIHFIAFDIVSLEADAQMLAREQRRRSGRGAARTSSGTRAAAAARVATGVLGGDAARLFTAYEAAGTLADGDDEGARQGRAAPAASAARRIDDEDERETDVLDGIAFSVFERALEQLVTLGEGSEADGAVEAALRKPVARTLAAEELRKNMFAVLDAVYKVIRMEPALASRDGDDRSVAAALASTGNAGEAGEDEADAVPGSLRTRRRWLLGLASFIRFMGPQTTPIALMLPTLLSRCARFRSLLPLVCIVWRELVCACKDEYLTESAASIVLSLVSLEQHTALERGSQAVLLEALSHLYTRTETAAFWDSYKVVLGTFSELVRTVLHARRSARAEATAVSQAQDGDGDEAMAVLLVGFVTVMQSSSPQSAAVFVRALYQYLCGADSATRLRLSHAAAAHPEVLQTLLRCSEVDGEGALYAMRCISILGAVATPPSASSKAKRPATEPEGSRALLTTSPSAAAGAVGVDVWSRMTWTQSCFLDAETVLNWRKFAFTLLKEYFPRVFASTTDPVLHNCIAFAVQELIRAATRQERLQQKGVELRREDVVHVDELERYLWWTRLTAHVKQLLGGFTTTRYALTVNWTTQLRDPEYTPALPYRRWLFAFFHHLAALCEGWFAEMVRPLRNVAKKSAALVLGLLPYLVVHLLESGREGDVQYIRGEVMAVLEATAGDDGAAPVSLRSQSIYEVTPESSPADEPREHAHTVLSVLEDVEQLRWTLLRHRGRVPCVFEEQEQTEHLCVRLAEVYGAFVASIPWALRCRAALRIGSHVRALRSVEGQRRIPRLAGVIAEVPVQRIFAALNDRESSRAVHRASPGLLLEETAFSLENNGDWLAALGSAELVLQHRPHSGQHQLTALHCMNELGELYMTSRYAASLLAATAPGTPSADAGDGRAALRDPLSRSALASSATFSQLNTGSSPRVPAIDAAQLRRHVQSYANEAAWRLGQWDTLLPSSTATEATAATPFGIAGGLSVSLAMPAAQLQRALTGSGSLAHVCRVTDGERAKVVPLVRTPCQEDLAARGYTLTLLLHALGDVDAVAELCAGAFVEGAGQDEAGAHRSTSQASAPLMKLDAPLLPSAVKEAIADVLTQRASYADDTIAAREPLLALHRLIYRELRMPQRVAQTWLKQAELLRNGGLGEAALTAARQAAFECPDHVAETDYYALVANLLHDTQAPAPAIEFVRECLDDRRVPAKMRAQLQMLRTNWLIETGSEPPDRVIAEYRRALEYDARSELVHHQLALFYDRLNTLACNASEGAAAQRTTASSGVGATSSTGGANVSAAALYDAALQHQREMVAAIHAHVTRAVEHYGEALRRGVATASVSLPRLLTLWLDSAAYLGGVLSTTAGKLDGTAAAALEELNNRLRDLVLSTVKAVIPPAVVMSALPQLLSRLGHPVPAVRGVLTDIVLHLLGLFPQQCLWLVLPMALSKEGPKEVVETQIIKPFADNPRNERVLRHAKMICDTLLTICNCSASLFPKDKGLTQLNPVQKITPTLPAARFIVPVLANLTPNTGAGSIDAVFPAAPCLHHFDDAVVVMRSLQKPKRIWVHTDDGRRMSFLCKAKDEPRKDIRMMEVAALMNSFFCTDPEAKRKRFALRRYAITALSDDCAIIEWLNDTTPLAKVAMECYSLDRSGVHISAVKKWVALVDEGKLSKRDLFEKYILPEAGPVMHQWLDRTFASNQSWYEARTLFTQSTALWSIAGHIVGLGDRHAENLMIDMERGELMHVDFACMFDKGEKLEVPERVRFRLTQNLTDVMGVLGARGPFQATCEVALRCEMKNKSAVMSIVETLLHEPLVEWRRQSSRSSAANGPKQLMERVARRLDGFLDLYAVPPQRDTLALNVESQVGKLIHHSSDLENLSQMYIWWMAWI